jgi:hypothetical protein
MKDVGVHFQIWALVGKLEEYNSKMGEDQKLY